MAHTLIWAREIGNEAIWDSYTLKFDSMGTFVLRLFDGSCTMVKNNLSIIILAAILIET